MAGEKSEQSPGFPSAATGTIRKEVAIAKVKEEDSCVEQLREAEITTRESAVLPSSSTQSPPEVTDFARADAVSMKRCSGSSRGRENSQLANRREDVEQRNTSLPTPGGSETLQENSEGVERALLTPRGDKLVERAMRSTSAGEGKRREALGHTVPSPETPTPPEGGDFAGAERSTEKKHNELQREGSSPPDNHEKQIRQKKRV